MRDWRSNRAFVPRDPRLLALEGDYGLFQFSCRHRDILRCSATRHFESCYRRGGGYSEVPFTICSNPSFAMIFRRDPSGQFRWRVFVKVTASRGYPVQTFHDLNVGKFYGTLTELDKRLITDKIIDLSKTLFREVRFTGTDLTLY